MKEMIPIDNPTLTHMLGYLDGNKWKDALIGTDYDKEMMWELLKVQDGKYKSDVTGEVKELILDTARMKIQRQIDNLEQSSDEVVATALRMIENLLGKDKSNELIEEMDLLKHFRIEVKNE